MWWAQASLKVTSRKYYKLSKARATEKRRVEAWQMMKLKAK